jgi:putative flavoprotein involved in K+ transport
MRTDTIIIGAGQAGLSLSRHLTRLGRDHVVLERGDVGERWRSERWDSLRLLTPNWLNTLEGSRGHADRDGYLASAEFVAYLERYARSTGAPVQSNVDVVGVEHGTAGFRVRTDAGNWHTANVVLATGFADVPHRPRSAAEAPRHLHQMDAARYRTPSAVAAGGVLVVGSGPSGQQIAAELRRAGRHVVLAAGRHGRLPRRYLGQDIWHWLNEIGDVDRVIDDPLERARLRGGPSLALTGANGGEQLDLGVLHALGVVIAGRLAGFHRGRALFADDLRTTVAGADDRMRHVLDRIDAHVEVGGGAQIEPGHLPAVRLPDGPQELDLAREGISTVVWATGYRRDYRWLQLPVLDDDGELEHRRGVTPVPGLYALGLKFQHRKSSHQISGVSRDARFIAAHLGSAAAVRTRRPPEQPYAAAA